MWRRILIDQTIEIGAEPGGLNRGRAREGREGGVAADKPVTLNGSQLADRDAVAGDREALTGVEGSHDFTALVAELSLCQLPSHG